MLIRIIIPNRRISKEVIFKEFFWLTSMDILRPEIFWTKTICLLLSTIIVECNYKSNI